MERWKLVLFLFCMWVGTALAQQVGLNPACEVVQRISNIWGPIQLGFTAVVVLFLATLAAFQLARRELAWFLALLAGAGIAGAVLYPILGALGKAIRDYASTCS